MQHHAVLIEGSDRTVWETCASDLLGAQLTGHADYRLLEVSRVGIDEARTVQAWASVRPLGARLVIVLAFESATREAQNALLKLLEEPPEGVHFIVAVPTREALLPTVRSRLTRVQRAVLEPRSTDRVRAFLDAPHPERLKIIERILGKEGARDRKGVREFLDELEVELYARFQQDSKRAHALAEVVFVRQYLLDRSASLKQLLEHVALAV